MIFISHASEDQEMVRELSTALITRNLKPWWDSMRLRVGDELTPRIFGAIERSRVVVVVMSEASCRSEWVVKEVRHALKHEATGALVIVPVQVEPDAVIDLLADRIFHEVVGYEPGAVGSLADIDSLADYIQHLLEPEPAVDRYEPVEGGPWIDWGVDLGRGDGGRFHLTIDTVSQDPGEDYCVLCQFEFIGPADESGLRSDREQAVRLLRACVGDFEEHPARLRLRRDEVKVSHLSLVDDDVEFTLGVRTRRLGRVVRGTLLFNVGAVLCVVADGVERRLDSDRDGEG